ncbi:hypothetical protein LMBIIBHN_01266 [Aeromonas salmonicida]
MVAERSKRGHERQARLFGYDSELNLCELSHILPSDGQPLSSQQAQAEPLRHYDTAGRVSQMGPNQYRYDKCGRLSEKVVSRPGFMQLLPMAQHQSLGVVQSSLHSNGKGGMQNWGGGRN